MPDRRDILPFDRCDVGRDAYPHSFTQVGIGTVVVASAWLALYVLASVNAIVFGH
jgi:hypothetical protein